MDLLYLLTGGILVAGGVVLGRWTIPSAVSFPTRPWRYPKNLAANVEKIIGTKKEHVLRAPQSQSEYDQWAGEQFRQEGEEGKSVW